MSGWKIGDECEIQLFSRGWTVGVVCEARGDEWRIADTQGDDWAWSCVRAPSEMRRPGQAEAERDAAIAERDALRRVLAEKCDALVWKRLVGAEMQLDEVRAERDRLRRELEALRDEMREWCYGLDTAACHRAVIYGPTIERIDAILSGGES